MSYIRNLYCLSSVNALLRPYPSLSLSVFPESQQKDIMVMLLAEERSSS